MLVGAGRCRRCRRRGNPASREVAHLLAIIHTCKCLLYGLVESAIYSLILPFCSQAQQQQQQEKLELIGPEPQRFVVAEGQLKSIASAAFPFLMRLGSGGFVSGYNGEAAAGGWPGSAQAYGQVGRQAEQFHHGLPQMARLAGWRAGWLGWRALAPSARPALQCASCSAALRSEC